MPIHGKTLTKGMSKTRKGSISIGIDKLLKAQVINKGVNIADLVSFGSEVLKKANYSGSEQGVTTTSGMKLESAKEGAPENTLTQEILSKPRRKTAAKPPDAEEFKVTKREAERAARRLVSPGTTPRRVARNMGTFAVLSPISGTLAKGVAAGATSKGQRGRAAYKAMKGALNKEMIVERSVGGAVAGAALSALSEGRDIRRSRETVERYLKETKATKPTVKKLKAVL